MNPPTACARILLLVTCYLILPMSGLAVDRHPEIAVEFESFRATAHRGNSYWVPGDPSTR